MNTPASRETLAADACRYSDAQLRAAWRQYRLRTWPATFEEAMNDAIYARLVRIHAAHMAHRPSTAGELPAVHQARRFSRTPPPGYVDMKRAAAGDRDD